LVQGSSTQILGFTQALERHGHSVTIDLSGDQIFYPKVKTAVWMKWIKTRLPVSWLLYELVQILNNQKISYRLNDKNFHNYDLLWQRYELFTTAYSVIAQQAKIPQVLFFDAPLISERESFGHLWLKRRAIKVLKRNVTLADLVVAISDPVANYVRKYIKDEDLFVHIMPNGFSSHILKTNQIKIDTLRYKYFGDFSGPIVGFVGSIKPWHRVDYLLRVTSCLIQARTDFRVLIVGDGPDLTRQQQIVKELGISSYVKFVGRIAFSEIADYLKLMDMGVMPDSNTYGSPMKITEYMASGAAVIAPRLKPIEALCTDGQEGLLFTKDDLSSLHDAINLLLDNKEFLYSLGRNAKRRALEEHSWGARIRQIEPLLEKIVSDYDRTGSRSYLCC
jgi:glycosyltransferase involved in cell wall biosynthesis